LPAEPVVVTGWPDGLRIAVDNLLVNAVRHGTSERRRSIQVSVRHGDTVAQVVVDDAGPGIHLEEREAVFARFRRGRNAPRSGSGLGLALVRQQAALHGGRAWVETSPLGGTRAVLQIASEPVERSSGSRQSLLTADFPA
jgi:two-component system, OmpR family, sensor histidine kinase PrrB